ncbi:SpoIIE family protein phosphatase [Pseudonocardia xinjiangensis]|uniref:SpoIIE family protein phosphatase n=1 Tax=Pseudonocardia xinjiangensis TaxID=75289 RepID=A0ABX1RA51_9PSEU|nr:SpoIIE family protein phosphatase [Pseudonocardia xinjiangensis]NMH75995.1 SpoIIE family protein phosphatase [Pseudonocardia xinjiangensis]
MDQVGRPLASRDRFLAELERALQPLQDPDEVMATVAQLLGEHMQVDRSAYAEAEADEDHFTMTGSYARGLPELTGRMAMSDFSADTLRCMREGVPYVLADAETDPRVLPEQRGIYHRTGIVAVICVPLHKAGRFVAAMAVHQRTPRVWTAAEIDLVTTVAGRCWESLQRAHAIAAVRESEEQFRLLVERATDAIWLADGDRRYLDVNPAACALLGYSREEHLMLGAEDIVRPEDIPRLNRLLTALADGASVTEVWELRRRDGSTVPVELSMRSAGHGRVQAIGRDITQRRRAEAERERLLRREQEANRQLQLLQQATAALSAAATPAQVGVATVDQLRRLLGARSVAVWRRGEAGDLQALAVEGWPTEIVRTWSELPPDAADPVTGAAAGRSVWLDTDDSWAGHDPHLRKELARHGIDGLVCLPLLAAGRSLGVVAMALPAQHPLGATERASAESLVEQCAQALHRAGLLQAERVARRAAEELSDIVAALSGATTPAEVADVVLDHAAGLGAESAVLMLREGPRLEPIAARGPAAVALRPVTLDATDPLAAAVRSARAVWSGSPVAVPLLLSNRVVGVVGMWLAAEEGATPELGADQRGPVLTVAGQCAQALDRARLHQAEHEVADVLQRSLLPRELPALARLAAAAHYTPAAEHALSGGDWYDLLPLGGTRVALVVGDVVGHGPGAAAVMGQLRSALATHLLDGCSPAAALERLDRFAARLRGATGSTCACLTFDWSTRELRWAMAGHPPVLLVDGDDARFLDGGAGAVLGLRGRPPYQEAATTVAPGSSVILYTDGLVERRHEVVDKGLDRLLHVAAQLGHLGPDGLAAGLVETVLDEAGPADDVALLVVRAVPAPLRGRLPAAATSMSPLRREVSDWAAAAGLPEESTEDLELAVGEAAANAAEHAYPDGGGEFDYSLTRTDDGAVDVRVRDHGRWRPVPTDNGHRGHGLRVIGELVDGFVIDRGPDGTEARFRLPAAAPAPDGRPGGTAARSRSRTRAPVGASVEHRQGPAGERVLAVHGDLDLAGRDIVGPALLTSAGIGGPLVVDLTGVGYLSSAGVALLAEAHAAAGPGLSILLTPGSAAARVLLLTGLATELPVSGPDGTALR